MAAPELIMPEYVNLKTDDRFTEKWLQDCLENSPELLGLGELVVKDRERLQPNNGRLDLLLEEAENLTRYTVEIQLGKMDESHLIRAIEYWDFERRRFPQYDHIAVIVAEDVTSRFLNVISLINRDIPLIAFQIKGVEVNGAFTLVATRVVDLIKLGTEEEGLSENADRSYWERKASSNTLEITDDLCNLINELLERVELRYNKAYIGLTYEGQARNFVAFIPGKNYVTTKFNIPKDDELTTWIDETGISVTPSYDSAKGEYRVRVRQNDIEDHRCNLIKLITKACNADSRIPDVELSS